MNNIEELVGDIISQLRLHDVISRKAYLGVYVARQNLIPVTEALLKRAEAYYKMSFPTMAKLDRFLEQAFGHKIDIWQKPAPHSKPVNHLTLTIGGYTVVIFDYTEHE